MFLIQFGLQKHKFLQFDIRLYAMQLPPINFITHNHCPTLLKQRTTISRLQQNTHNYSELKDSHSTQQVNHFRGKTVKPRCITTMKCKSQRGEIPSKAKMEEEMIHRKKCILKIKHNVNDIRAPVPDIIQIQDSVRSEQVSFRRRMGMKLNNGNANLLQQFRKNMHLETRDYLKEMGNKLKRDRRLLQGQKEQDNVEHLSFGMQINLCDEVNKQQMKLRLQSQNK